MRRITSLKNKIQDDQKYSRCFGIPNIKSDDDIVIIEAVRTPITKSFKGKFNITKSEKLLTKVFDELCSRSKLNPSFIEDVIVGNVLLKRSD